MVIKVNKTIRNVGVDAGMIIISDVDVIEKDREKELSKSHIFEMPNGFYEVTYDILDCPESKGQNILEVRSGKVVVTDPCYIIDHQNWESFLEKVYSNWKKTGTLQLDKAYLYRHGMIIIDTMGGDGTYTVHLELIKM
jgi:hypothetical protein